MIGSLAVLLVGLGIAGASAAVGVATAAVSQVELTRWVSYKLRGAGAAARLLENPGRMLATANALTTLGIICAAASSPALLAQTTATFLGVFTVTVGVPLFVSAAYLVPRVVGRRWAEPIVAHAVPWLERLGRPLGAFIPWRDPSARSTLAAVLSNADTDALASADLMLEMQRGRTHPAVVLDEFGGTAGVVTLEDLLRDLVEEIFGERAALPAAAAAASAGVLEVDANAPLGRIEAAFSVGLASPGVQSVGGLLIQALGRIPRPGERFLLRGFEFDILAATATRVERVAVRPGPVRAVPLDRAEERG